MSFKKIFIIIGTRPDAIKMAPVIHQMSDVRCHKLACQMSVKPVVVVSAQHRELLDQVLQVFSIKPDFDLNIMKQGQDLYYITTKTLQGLKKIFKQVKPNLVLVQGDTTTTFIGALAGFYEKIAVGHIEAGLRSHNKYSPYPEEMNRKFTDCIADFCFAPTELARNNLLNEGVNPEKIWVTGNTAIDALFMVLKMDYRFKDKRLKEIIESGRKLILVTAHRRESFSRSGHLSEAPERSSSPLQNICYALIELKKRFKEIEIIYSVHPNPNVRKPVYKLLGNISGIHLIEPPDYLCFSNLMKRAFIILTDSGGIQEEAPSIGKPVLVMREVTERVEGIEAGTAILVGTDKDKIVKSASLLLTDKSRYESMSKVSNPYGDGKASERIVNVIQNKLSLTKK